MRTGRKGQTRGPPPCRDGTSWFTMFSTMSALMGDSLQDSVTTFGAHLCSPLSSWSWAWSSWVKSVSFWANGQRHCRQERSMNFQVPPWPSFLSFFRPEPSVVQTQQENILLSLSSWTSEPAGLSLSSWLPGHQDSALLGHCEGSEVTSWGSLCCPLFT